MFLVEKTYSYSGPEISDDTLGFLVNHVFTQYGLQVDDGARSTREKTEPEDALIYHTAKYRRDDAGHHFVLSILFATQNDAERIITNYRLNSLSEELEIPYQAVGIKLNIKMGDV